MELLGVTYSEFDNAVGPQLLYEYPKSAISSDVFEAVSEYVIVGKHLCEKIIMVSVDDVKFLNYSVAIENSKYYRNTLSFALGFVLAEDTNSEPYEHILRKLSKTLVSMEMENEFLFNESTKKKLGEVLLKNIYDGLRMLGEIFVQFDDANLLSVRLLKDPLPPRAIQSYDIPVLLQSETTLTAMPWDITVMRIVHCIDGEISVQRIADEADIDMECVCRCLRALLFYDCVLLTSVFLFSNIYRTTIRVLDLYPSQVDLSSTLASSPWSQSTFKMMGENLTDLQKESIFRFLLSLRPGVTIGKLIVDNLNLLRGIDIPRIIAIAQHCGIIEKIQAFPIFKVGDKFPTSKLSRENEDKSKSSLSTKTSKSKKSSSNSKNSLMSKSPQVTSKNRKVPKVDNNNNKSKSTEESISGTEEYFCGPCLDELLCKKVSLNLSDSDMDEIETGNFIYL